MLGCGVSRLVVVVVVVMLTVVEGQEEVQEDCSDIRVLGACNEDQGPIYPTDGQSVYLGHPDLPGYWRCPAIDGYVKHGYPHDTRTITETKDSWARWIWHDCGDQYVCMESARYPNHYYYISKFIIFWTAHAYSFDPKTDYWTRQKIHQKYTTSRGLYMSFLDERWYNEGYWVGLDAYIYIPPRCEGYKKIVDKINNSTVEYRHQYTYERGVVSTRTSTAQFDSSLKAEIVKGIVSASLSRSFSMSWVNEQTTALSHHQTHARSVVIPPMKRMVVWQKVATYGLYAWNSGVYFKHCVSDF